VKSYENKNFKDDLRFGTSVFPTGIALDRAHVKPRSTTSIVLLSVVLVPLVATIWVVNFLRDCRKK